MSTFATARFFQAKPSNLKKKVALVAFVAGATAFTLAVTGVIGPANGGIYFGGGLVAMAFAFRFWTMQVNNPVSVTFDTKGVTISEKSSSRFITWSDLESIRYRVWRGGHYWEFKSRNRTETVDYYVDGLTSRELRELRETISSIVLPGVLIEPDYNPLSS